MPKEDWEKNRHPPFGKVGEDPEFDKKRLEGSRKGVETRQRKAKIRKMLKESPSEIYEDALAAYLADNPTFTADLVQMLAENAKDGDNASLKNLKDIFGYGAPKKAPEPVSKKEEVKQLSKEEVAEKLKMIKGGKS